MACPLTSASAGTTDPDYGYTGDGLRAWKQVGSARTYFLYDGTDPVNELDATGTVQAVNTFGPTGLLSRHTTTSTFYAFDPTGNVAERLDGSGNILAQYTFDAFGMRVGTDSSTDPYSGFGGQWGYYSDGETGLELLTNRYYDSSTGRFVTRDPISYNGGVNIYSYVRNNPLNEFDPSGLDPVIGDQLPDIELGYRPPSRGDAPLDKDGNPIELHHRNQCPDGPVDELDWVTHRGKGNHGKNHPRRNTGVDHGNDWKKWKRKYWEQEWDKGRFKTLPDYTLSLPSTNMWHYVDWGTVGVSTAIAGLGIISALAPESIPATGPTAARLLPLLAR